MDKVTAFTDQQKLEALALWELEGWATTEASRRLGVCRPTLLGWRAAENKVQEGVNNGIKTRPGPEASTHSYEEDLVRMIKLSSDIDAQMTRAAIIDHCVANIVGFKKRTRGAQLSWLNRFIERHKLREFIATYAFHTQPSKKKLKVSLPEVMDAPADVPVMSLIVSPKTSVNMPGSHVDSPSSPIGTPLSPLNTPSVVDVPAAPPNVISLVGTEDAVEYDSGGEYEDKTVDPSNIVCETRTPSFAPGKISIRLVVQRTDLETLQCDNWLNDVVIMYYIREHIPVYGRAYIMDSNFFGYIFAAFKFSGRSMKAAYERCCGITSTFPYENYDLVIVPINMGYHWTIAVVQNPVLAVVDLRRCIAHVDSLGISKIETVKKVVGGYFDEEMGSKYADKKATAFVMRGVHTSSKQINTDDCGVFLLCIMKRVIEAFLQGGVLLFLDIDKICTLSRSTRFSPAMFRKKMTKLLSSGS